MKSPSLHAGAGPTCHDFTGCFPASWTFGRHGSAKPSWAWWAIRRLVNPPGPPAERGHRNHSVRSRRIRHGRTRLEAQQRNRVFNSKTVRNATCSLRWGNTAFTPFRWFRPNNRHRSPSKWNIENGPGRGVFSRTTPGGAYPETPFCVWHRFHHTTNASTNLGGCSALGPWGRPSKRKRPCPWAQRVPPMLIPPQVDRLPAPRAALAGGAPRPPTNAVPSTVTEIHAQATAWWISFVRILPATALSGLPLRRRRHHRPKHVARIRSTCAILPDPMMKPFATLELHGPGRRIQVAAPLGSRPYA